MPSKNIEWSWVITGNNWPKCRQSIKADVEYSEYFCHIDLFSNKLNFSCSPAPTLTTLTRKSWSNFWSKRLCTFGQYLTKVIPLPTGEGGVICLDWLWHVMTYHDKTPDFATKNNQMSWKVTKYLQISWKVTMNHFWWSLKGQN